MFLGVVEFFDGINWIDWLEEQENDPVDLVNPVKNHLFLLCLIQNAASLLDWFEPL